MKKLCFIFLLLVIGMYQNAQAQVMGYVGEIRLFAGNFAPQGWAFCDGKTLPVKEYQALFALLGNKHGGDGTTNFALPDLRGRVPMAVTPDEVGKINSKNDNNINVVNGSPTIVQIAPPYLGLYYIICVQGSFPARN